MEDKADATHGLCPTRVRKQVSFHDGELLEGSHGAEGGSRPFGRGGGADGANHVVALSQQFGRHVEADVTRNTRHQNLVNHVALFPFCPAIVPVHSQTTS